EPATAVVFGEKGSGKTALRLQIVRHLTDYNADHPQHQVLVVQYDDFNAYLDRFRERFSGKRRCAERVLEHWRLWDHMDAILAQCVTQLVDRLLQVKQTRHPAARDDLLPHSALDPAQVRDVMLLAAYYDQSTAQNPLVRWKLLRKKLGFPVWRSKLDLGFGVLVTLAAIAFFIWFDPSWFARWLPYLIIAGAWTPRAWRWIKCRFSAWKIARHTRVLNHSVGLLRKILLNFPTSQIVGQAMPDCQRTDDRYELLGKLQGVLETMRVSGIIVLVDRVDEPYLINGSTELMRALVWPILDNKLLKHPGLGIKLLLPIELERLVDRESHDFHQRARLDKQNMIRSLAWTGQSLYDMALARIRACNIEGRSPALTTLFDQSVDQHRLIDAFSSLRVPRHLFKFLFRLFTAHCNAHSEENPVWQISSGTFESALALYLRDQDAFDRGVGAG
ncbi:MAG: hypothetical protein ACWGMZ_04345, partial [Thermoguttaceae bacterium]